MRVRGETWCLRHTSVQRVGAPVSEARSARWAALLDDSVQRCFETAFANFQSPSTVWEQLLLLLLVHVHPHRLRSA